MNKLSCQVLYIKLRFIKITVFYSIVFMVETINMTFVLFLLNRCVYTYITPTTF